MPECITEETGPMAGEIPVKRRLLVVDDDTSIRMLLSMAFRLRGFECVLAENGMAAQPIIQREHFDVIVVDLMMPAMDGLSFIQWLRAVACDQTPVLVLTSVHSPEVTLEARKAGANGVALKPIRMPQILEALNKLIKA
jgi:two-component system NtrC family response regulator/two-component system response regulator AtoC